VKRFTSKRKFMLESPTSTPNQHAVDASSDLCVPHTEAADDADKITGSRKKKAKEAHNRDSLPKVD
jgi:hypothetical protein